MLNEHAQKLFLPCSPNGGIEGQAHDATPGLGLQNTVDIASAAGATQFGLEDARHDLLNRWEMALARGERWRLAPLTRRRINCVIPFPASF